MPGSILIRRVRVAVVGLLLLHLLARFARIIARKTDAFRMESMLVRGGGDGDCR
jgi:hypothetical protein